MIYLILLMLCNCNKEVKKRGTNVTHIENPNSSIQQRQNRDKDNNNISADKNKDNETKSYDFSNLLQLINNSNISEKTKKEFVQVIDRFKKGEKINAKFIEEETLRENKWYNSDEDKIVEFSPLMIALYFNDLKGAKYMLEKGENVNEVVKYIFTRKTSPLNYFMEKMRIINRPEFNSQILFLLNNGAKYYFQKEGVNISKGISEVIIDFINLAKSIKEENWREDIISLIKSIEADDPKKQSIEITFIDEYLRSVQNLDNKLFKLFLSEFEYIDETRYSAIFIDAFIYNNFALTTTILNYHLDNKPQERREMAEKNWRSELLNLKTTYTFSNSNIEVNLLTYSVLHRNRDKIKWLIDNGLSKRVLNEKSSEGKTAVDYDNSAEKEEFIRDANGTPQWTGRKIKDNPILPDFEGAWN